LETLGENDQLDRRIDLTLDVVAIGHWKRGQVS